MFRNLNLKNWFKVKKKLYNYKVNSIQKWFQTTKYLWPLNLPRVQKSVTPLISCRPIGNGSPKRSKISYYAEEGAPKELQRLRPDAIRKRRGYTLKVFNNRNEFAPSMPCKRCKKMLKQLFQR